MVASLWCDRVGTIAIQRTRNSERCLLAKFGIQDAVGRLGNTVWPGQVFVQVVRSVLPAQKAEQPSRALTPGRNWQRRPHTEQRDPLASLSLAIHEPEGFTGILDQLAH